ncbi:uncharacterized protein G2W53_020854 [Senna tora]|uniref:Uncharacterized protein n=1 Tax=Senna tora TaxID=362788 RepID=A0A834WGN3_9FABA|nr:uncharacterized protein G2W53_020854 [Senna tora]
MLLPFIHLLNTLSKLSALDPLLLSELLPILNATIFPSFYLGARNSSKSSMNKVQPPGISLSEGCGDLAIDN